MERFSDVGLNIPILKSLYKFKSKKILYEIQSYAIAVTQNLEFLEIPAVKQRVFTEE